MEGQQTNPMTMITPPKTNGWIAKMVGLGKVTPPLIWPFLVSIRGTFLGRSLLG